MLITSLREGSFVNSCQDDLPKLPSHLRRKRKGPLAREPGSRPGLVMATPECRVCVLLSLNPQCPAPGRPNYREAATPQEQQPLLGFFLIFPQSGKFKIIWNTYTNWASRRRKPELELKRGKTSEWVQRNVHSHRINSIHRSESWPGHSPRILGHLCSRDAPALEWCPSEGHLIPGSGLQARQTWPLTGHNHSQPRNGFPPTGQNGLSLLLAAAVIHCWLF